MHGDPPSDNISLPPATTDQVTENPIPTQTPLPTLTDQLRAGSITAFTTIMTQYANQLTKFAYYLTKSRDSADDIVQQVFIHLWERKETLDPASRLQAYLYRAVRNRSINLQQSSKVRNRYISSIQTDIASGTTSATIPNPEHGILARLDVQSAIEQLSHRRRIALRLRYEEGMSHTEIAEILEVSPEAAQRLVARAIADLREILESRV